MEMDVKTWSPQNSRWLAVSVLVIFIDQLTKFVVRKKLLPYVPVKIFSWLNFSLAFNSGAAYSFLNSQPGWARWTLVTIAILVIGYLLIWILQAEPYKKWLLFALTLILGGAVSNLIDRFWSGYVTDFISFHINNWYFATFNIADSAISVGAVILVFLLLFKRD